MKCAFRQRLLNAEFVQHVNIPLRSKYLPEQKLLKKWCVRNVGSDDWDKRVMLEFTKGTESLPTKNTFPVPECSSGSLCELSAMIMTPKEPGRYTSYFRLSREGTFFGPRILGGRSRRGDGERIAGRRRDDAKALRTAREPGYAAESFSAAEFHQATSLLDAKVEKR
eukprot:UN04248